MLVMKREVGFWMASGLAFSLSLLSWVNPVLIRGLNGRLFHEGPQAAPGEWLYLVLRVPVTALLVWIIFRLPRDPQATAARPAARRQGVSRPRMFDPLMGLRALACLFVLMGHYFLVVFPFTDTGYPRGVLTLLHSSPWGGVWVFFTLSGFLMGKGFATGRYPLDGRGMRSFLRNRLIRIAPVYYSGFLLVTIFRYPAMLDWKNLWMFLDVCLFDFRGDLPINSINALWSVSTEMQFYLLAPVLAMILLGLRERLGKGFLTVPALLLFIETGLRMLLVTRHLTFTYDLVYTPLLTNLDVFVAGMSISMLEVPRVRSELGKKVLSGLLAAGIVVLYVGISYLTQHRVQKSLQDFWARGPALCVLPAALYIYLAEMRGKIEIRGVATGLLLLVQGMGTLTYCIYVFHSEVFLANATLVPPVHSLKVSLTYLPLAIVETLFVACFFYFFIEKPFDLKKKVPGTPLADAP